MTSFQRDLLQVSLATAVPLHIAELRGRSTEDLLRIAQESATEVASHGDVVLYRSKKKGATASAFNALARGLAVLAFAPGGVTFMEMHWEVAGPGPLSSEELRSAHRRIVSVSTDLV